PPMPLPCADGDTTSSLRYARNPTSCAQANPSIVSPSTWTRAIVSAEPRARWSTSSRQPSSQKPATDCISVRMPSMSEAPAPRITATPLTGAESEGSVTGRLDAGSLDHEDHRPLGCPGSMDHAARNREPLTWIELHRPSLEIDGQAARHDVEELVLLVV